jgi:hypothetical protein
MSVTYQDLLDAIKSIEMHHFQDTTIVICCLVTVDGRAIMGCGANADGELFDITRNAARARQAADKELAKQLETHPVEKPEPVAEGAAQ